MKVDHKTIFAFLAMLQFVCVGILGMIVVDATHTTQQRQIVEKGEYHRIQYIVDDGVMTPEFIEGYYYVLRNGNTGKEDKVEISEEKFEACVVGDVVERY